MQPTPYNTYIIDGLPPGPICNPGKAALEAVANPAKTKDLYFVADGTGGHAFAETLDQHLKNVAHWRQIEKDAKDKVAPDAGPPGAAAPTPVASSRRRRDLFGDVHAGAAGEARSARFRRSGRSRPLARQTGRKGKALTAKLAKLGNSRSEAAGPVRRGRRAPVAGHVVGQDDRRARRRHHRRQRRAGTSLFGDDRPARTRAARSPARRCRRPRSPNRRRARPNTAWRDRAAVRRRRRRAARAPLAARQGRRLRRLRRHALDPLKNKTYDLSFAKDVPNLKSRTTWPRPILR